MTLLRLELNLENTVLSVTITHDPYPRLQAEFLLHIFFIYLKNKKDHIVIIDSGFMIAGRGCL